MKNRKSYEVKIMKYEEPNMDIVEWIQNDIITKSPGGGMVEDPKPPVDENEPDWGVPF